VPTVTALRRVGPGRLLVELDGAPWRALPEEAVVAAALAPGRSLDRPRARALWRALRRYEALAASQRALAPRELSERALAARLARRGVAPAQRREALETLARAGYVDDARVALRRAAELAGRGLGDAAIRADLEAKGLDGEPLEAALDALESERIRAERIVERHGRVPKTGRLLARRGFDAEIVDALVANEQ
jgi:SOS response regulatory protein OraA/RecX